MGGLGLTKSVHMRVPFGVWKLIIFHFFNGNGFLNIVILSANETSGSRTSLKINIRNGHRVPNDHYSESFLF